MISHAGGVYIRPEAFPLDVEEMHTRINTLVELEKRQTTEILALKKNKAKAKEAHKVLANDYKAAFNRAADEAVRVTNMELKMLALDDAKRHEEMRRREAGAGRYKAEGMLKETEAKLENACAERDSAISKMKLADGAASAAAKKLEVQSRNLTKIERALEESRAAATRLKGQAVQAVVPRTTPLKGQIETLSVHVQLLLLEITMLEANDKSNVTQLFHARQSLLSMETHRDDLIDQVQKEKVKGNTLRLLKELREAVGLKKNETVPARKLAENVGQSTKEHHHAAVARHLTAVVRGRGADQVIAAYRKANGAAGMEELGKTKKLQPIIEKAVLGARSVLQDRFDGRHGLYLQSVFDLSRCKYNDLNNATFNTYDAEADSYNRMIIWENPKNPADTVYGPSFAGR
jgi:hypothetical protein